MVAIIVAALITATAAIAASLILASHSSPQQPPATGATTPASQSAMSTPSLMPTISETSNAGAPQTPTLQVPHIDGSSLTLQVDFGKQGAIGPGTYRNPMRFGWSSMVFDDHSELTSGCYIAWALYKSGQRIYTYSTVCHNNPLTTMDLGPGTYNFVGNITTDSGRSGSGSKGFQVAD